ncbi:MAG: hypothetical protein Q4E05_01585 [Pseudoclavibacter sp.]|nr:hypothetical protein [Pseudoclavibacter sp.]
MSEQARRAALENWARLASRAGFRPPPAGVLAELARAGGVPPTMRSAPGVAAWEATLVWLMQQAERGVAGPERFLPPQLRVPRGAGPASVSPQGSMLPPGQGSFVAGGAAPARPVPPPAPAPRPPSSAPSAPPVPSAPPAPAPPPGGQPGVPERLARLTAWHSQAVRDGVENIWQIKETHLRLVANAKVASGDEIRAIFPPVVGQFADELAEALAAPAAGAPEAAAPPPAPDAAARAAQQSTDARPSGEQEPAAAEARLATTQTEPPEPDLSVDPEGFAPYEYGSGDERPKRVHASIRDGVVQLSWPAADPEQPGGEFVVDRLVAGDEYAPYSPDASRVVAVTRGQAAVDELPFSHAVRHYQLWRNRGDSEADAKRRQPVLSAQAAIVAPVLEMDLREDEGRVIGQWRVLPGTTRVQVFRIPVQKAAGASGDPLYRILADEANLGGFVDTEADRGQRYLYQVFAEAELDGVSRLSAPISNELLVSAVHEPVRDLSFELEDSEDAPLFDLRWSVPPGGQVVVYRTDRPPQPGIDRQALPAAALADAGLPESAKLAHPITLEGEQGSMRDVPWPRGWTRAYFTAVVLVADRAFVGNTVRGVRVPKVRRPKIVERVNRQVLTFEWPQGADVVLAYKSGRGVGSEIALQGQALEVSRSDYRERGGFEFEAGQLDATGCDLHLVPVAFDGGQRVTADAEVVGYAGLLRIEYRTLVQPGPGGVPDISLQLRSESDVLHAPPFVLVYRQDRLPLTIDEGRAIAVYREGGQAQRRFTPSPLTRVPGPASTWRVESQSFAQEARPGGYLRLFADLPPETLRRVALLDPPVGSLRVPGPTGGAVHGPSFA